MTSGRAWWAGIYFTTVNLVRSGYNMVLVNYTPMSNALQENYCIIVKIVTLMMKMSEICEIYFQHIELGLSSLLHAK